MLCYYAKANNKYMKDYDKYGWTMSQMSVHFFKVG